MKEYSAFARTTSAIIAIILSYFLVIINYRVTSRLLDRVIDNVRLWGVISFGGALLCIILPIVVAWYIFRFELRYLLWVFPIIFFLVLIYSPSGFYFIILKGGMWIEEPASDNWKYGIAISIMFYFIQFFAVSIAIGNKESKEERETELELQQDNLNQEEAEKKEKE